jgi:probable F420-dependent oxidoreductase
VTSPRPALGFGVMFRPGQFPLPHILACIRVAEDVGFEHIWFGDSHLIWHETGPYFTAAAMSTSRIRIGPLVANPVTRDPTVLASSLATLGELFDGRAVIGLGRGDSAVRTQNKKPMTVAEFRDAVRTIRTLARGDEVALHGTTLRFPWLRRRVPVLVAAYGPRVLALAGEEADGLILQLASPSIVEWAVRHARTAGEKAGRKWAEFEVVAGAPSYISTDRAHALSRVRGFPATVSNHVKDVLRQHAASDLPRDLVEGMEKIAGYDYLKHGHADAPHVRAVTDDMADRLTLIGTVDQVRAKIRELVDVGVTQVCLYLGVVEREHHFTLLETYGREIIPAFR